MSDVETARLTLRSDGEVDLPERFAEFDVEEIVAVQEGDDGDD